MPTFPTPEPIHVLLAVGAGDVALAASERDDTIVEVRPRDPSRKADVRAAEQTRVELATGRLVVKSPRPTLGWTRGGVIDVTIALPTGSRVDGHTGVGDLRAEGVLTECTLKTGAGAVRLGEAAGNVKAITGAGDISIERAAGQVIVVTGSGAVRIGDAAREVIVKNGNGSTTIDDAGADVRISASNGDIEVGRAAASLVAKTANGSIRVGAVHHGDVELRTALGAIDVGIAEGTAARLDVKTVYGLVRQELEPTGAPPSTAQKVTVKARTSMGDITIRRAAEPPGYGSSAAAAASAGA